MSQKSERARRRVLAMSEDQLRNEIRRLAGLEIKTVGAGCGSEPDSRGNAAFGDVALPSSSTELSKDSSWAGLEDMVVHGRTRRGKNPGRR